MTGSLQPAGPGEAAAADTAELARRVGAGDAAAEAALVERYGRGVRLLLDRHTRGRSDAEDLYQETFRLAIEKLRAGEVRDPERLPAFLARMARNLATEHYRKVGRRKTDAAGDTLEAAEGPEAGFPGAASAFPGALGEILDREKAALVRRVIGELGTGRDREVLYCFYIAEDDREEIAGDLGLTGLQLNRVLHRARERYRKLYERYAGSGGGGGGGTGAAVRMVLFLCASEIFSRLVSLTGWKRVSPSTLVMA